MYDALPDPIFAPDPASRREPSASERANGFSCGPFDRALFNHVTRLGLISQAELANLVTGVGLLCDPENMYQVYEAALRMHRVTEDTTLIVGPNSQFETLTDVMEYLSPLAIPANVYVTIQLLAGIYRLDSTSGAFNASHPFGHRIFIRGETLTGLGWPTIGSVRNANPAVVEGTLRGRFPTVVECDGVAGLVIEDHSIKNIENVLFLGSATGGYGAGGVKIGRRSGDEAGRGMLRAVQTWCHGFAGDGFNARFASSLTGYRVGATHNGYDGIRIINSSSCQLDHGVLCSYNAQDGWASRDGSEFQINSNQATGEMSWSEFNGQQGVHCRNNAIMKVFNATIRDNAAGGAGSYMSSTVQVETVSFSGNVGFDLRAVDVASIRGDKLTPAVPVCSPAAGTSGLHNSYIGLGPIS